MDPYMYNNQCPLPWDLPFATFSSIFNDKERGLLGRGLATKSLGRGPFLRGAAPLGLPGPLLAMDVGWHLIFPLPAPPILMRPLPKACIALINWFVVFRFLVLLSAASKPALQSPVISRSTAHISRSIEVKRTCSFDLNVPLVRSTIVEMSRHRAKWQEWAILIFNIFVGHNIKIPIQRHERIHIYWFTFLNTNKLYLFLSFHFPFRNCWWSIEVKQTLIQLHCKTNKNGILHTAVVNFRNTHQGIYSGYFMHRIFA